MDQVYLLSVLVIQALLIAGLLYQRRARRRADIQSALGGSLAHDLSQPLNSILHNAQAGEMLITSGRATPEALQEILADIRRADLRATEILERHRAMRKIHDADAG